MSTVSAPVFNSPEAVAQAKAQLQAWATKHPQAARELKALAAELVDNRETQIIGNTHLARIIKWGLGV